MTRSISVSKLYPKPEAKPAYCPRKRYVYVPHCPAGPGLDCPLVIDPTGVPNTHNIYNNYFHSS